MKRTVTYHIDVDTGKSRREASKLDESLEQVDNQMNQVNSSSIALGNVMADVLIDLAAQLSQVPGQIFNLATSAEETASKFNTVFGPAVEEVNTFIADFARLAGLSDTQAQELTSRIGAVAQGFGFAGQQSARFAQDITRLSADLQSFNNVPIEQTSNAVISALSGETEALKSLGIVIRQAEVVQRAMEQTGKDNAEAITQQERAMATYQLILEKAGPALGDTVRTQDSAANVARQLSAEWLSQGEALSRRFLPAINSVQTALLDITRSQAFQDFLDAVATGIDKASNAISFLVRNFNRFVPVIEGAVLGFVAYRAALLAARIVQEGLNFSLKAFRGALISTGIGAVVVLLGSLLSVILQNSEAFEGVSKIVRATGKIFAEVFTNLPGLVLDSMRLIAEIWETGFEGMNRFFDSIFDSITGSFLDFVTAIRQVITGDFTGAWETMQQIGSDSADRFSENFDGLFTGVNAAIGDLTNNVNFDPAIALMAEGGKQAADAFAEQFTFAGPDEQVTPGVANAEDQSGFAVQTAGQSLFTQPGRQPAQKSPSTQGGQPGEEQTDATSDAATESLKEEAELRLKNIEVIAEQKSKIEELDASEQKVAERRKIRQQQAIEQAIARSDSVKEAIKNVINALINETIANAIRNLFASTFNPFVAAALSGGLIATVRGLMGSLLNFEDGGKLSGPSHAQGGILATVEGIPTAELEGDEFIINRRSAAESDPLLRFINTSANNARVATEAAGLSTMQNGGRINRMPRSRGSVQAPSNSRGDSIADQVRQGLETADIRARVVMSELDEVRQDFDNLKDQLGVL